MKALDKNLAFLLCVVLILLGILIWVDAKFPNEGQIFQIVAGLLTGTSAIFMAAARHAFGLPEEKQPEKPPKEPPSV